MSSLPLVAVIGSTIASGKAAELGYGERDLEIYPTSSLRPICESGLLPIGLAVRPEVSGLKLCDVVSGVVVLHQDPGLLGPSGCSEEADRHPALPLVVLAMSRQLPVLAVGSGECLLAAALAGLARERFSDDVTATSGPAEGDTSTPDSDWSGALGVPDGHGLPRLVHTNTVPDGMRPVASGPDGSVYAVASRHEGLGSALSVRWDPGRLQPGDQARQGPFRWLRDQAANHRSRGDAAARDHPPAHGEAR